ncbi:MAG TPA: hypothetical protein VFI82_12645 [Terriglobales bacterium]|jgi:hypothetical protein|nr:hypothetical protein [Terriglobales bacterium]
MPALLEELQELADTRYGPRYKVIDADCPDGKRCGTAIMRDMLADDEDFYGVDFDEEDSKDDEDDQRSLKPAELSSRKKLRFVSYRRKLSPHGTRWEKYQRSLDAAAEWYSKANERDMQRRLRAASR